MKYRIRLVLLASISLAVSLFEFEAAAANRQSQERAARKACLVGDYDNGVAILSDLFLDTKNPTYIYNQGRCFEQSSRFQDAITRFEEYLRVTEGNITEKDKSLAEKHLAACREKLEKERAANPPPLLLPPPEKVPPVDSAAPSPTQAGLPEKSEPQAVFQSRQELEQPTGHRRGLLTAGIITGVLGAGGIATGIIYHLKANELSRTIEAAPAGQYLPSKEDNQQSKVTISKVAYGAGAACLIAGAILVTLGLRSGSPSSNTVALAPTVGPAQLGAVLTGAF